MKIKQGQKFMRVDKNTGHRMGWHTMRKNNTATMEWKQSVCQLVFIIRSGLDKGWYAT